MFTIALFCVTGDNDKWKEPFYFLQAADTQLGLIERYLEKKKDYGWTKEVELTRRTIVAANKMNPPPKFLVICGDLVDAMPGDPNRPLQVKDLKKELAGLKNSIPLVCVCGNHDVGDQPTVEGVEQYRRDFGPDYFSFVVSGVLMIVINSQYYEERSQVKDLFEEQEKWLDDLLASSKGKYEHIVVFQHIPWFLKEAEEEKDYFNIEINERRRMLNKFYDAGVRFVFCGHYHKNAGGKFKELELIVTSAVGAQLGDDKSGFRVVKVFKDSIQHKYYAIEDAPEEITFN